MQLGWMRKVNHNILLNTGINSLIFRLIISKIKYIYKMKFELKNYYIVFNKVFFFLQFIVLSNYFLKKYILK